MATRHALAGDINDLIGDEVADPRVRITTNLPPRAAVVDKTNRTINLGAANLDVAADGTFTADLIDTSSTDLNVDGLQYRLIIEGTVKGRGPGREVVYDTGMFSFTGPADVAELNLDEPALVPSWRSGFVDSMEALRTDVAEIALGDAMAAVEAVVPGAVSQAIADDPSVIAAAADYAASGVGVLTAGTAPTLAENRALDPQAKVAGGGASGTSYPTTRITTGLPAGLAHGIQTSRAGTLNTVIAEHRHGDLTGALRIPVTGGETVAATLRVWTDQTNARARALLGFLDAAGAVVSGTTVTGTTADLAASTWETRSVTGTAPPTAAYVYVTAVLVTTGANTVTGALARSTGLHLVGSDTAPTTYGDGTTSGWVWTGTAHASASKKIYLTTDDIGAGGTTDADLIAWATSEAFTPSGSIVRNGDGVLTSAAIIWPDASTGTFTATDTTGGYLNAYTATHVTSGKKVTQAAVTRNTAGDVTAVPTPTVGAI